MCQTNHVGTQLFGFGQQHCCVRFREGTPAALRNFLVEADTAQEDGPVVQIDIFAFYIKVAETNLLVEPVTFRSDGYIIQLWSIR